MAVVGEAVDGGVEAELTHPVFAHPAVEDFECGDLVHGDDRPFVFHQPSQHRAEDFAGHPLQPLARLAAEALVLVVEQPQVHLGDATGGDVPIHLG